MTLLVGQVLCAVAVGLVLSGLRRRRARLLADDVWSREFVGELRGES